MESEEMTAGERLAYWAGLRTGLRRMAWTGADGRTYVGRGTPGGKGKPLDEALADMGDSETVAAAQAAQASGGPKDGGAALDREHGLALLEQAYQAHRAMFKHMADCKACHAHVMPLCDGWEATMDATGTADYALDKLRAQAGSPAQPRVGWLVWSHEHGAWWGADECGYVTNVEAAGRYTLTRAAGIARRAGRQLRGAPNEVPVPAPETLEDWLGKATEPPWSGWEYNDSRTGRTT